MNSVLKKYFNILENYYYYFLMNCPRWKDLVSDVNNSTSSCLAYRLKTKGQPLASLLCPKVTLFNFQFSYVPADTDESKLQPVANWKQRLQKWALVNFVDTMRKKKKSTLKGGVVFFLSSQNINLTLFECQSLILSKWSLWNSPGVTSGLSSFPQATDRLETSAIK